MKSKLYFAFLIFIIACNDEPITSTCGNPIGSDDYSLTPGAPYTCYSAGIKGCIRLEVTGTSAFFRSIYNQTPSDAPVLKDMGEFPCLRELKEKPTTGLSYFVEARLHHGYTIKLADGTYGRFFVHSLETGSAGITKVNLVRQYSY